MADYTYDSSGSITKVTYPEGCTEYTYDNAFRLLSIANKKDDNSVINGYAYTYDLVGNQIEKDDTQDGGDWYTVTYTYDAYGNIYRYSTNYNDNIPITYTGEYLDEESGLVYLRNRYYNPSIGRFITEDIHWNPSNMIYGDKQKATKCTIIENKKVYYDDDGNIVKVEEFDGKEIAKGADKKDNSNQTNNMLYAIQRIPQSDAITQSGNLYAYAMNNPVKYADPSGKWVSGVGISAYAAYGIRIDVQGFYVWDDNGNSGIILIGGGGGGFPNAGVSGSTFYSHNTDTIFGLEGVSMSTGGGFSYFGADFNSNLSGTFSAGISVLPVDAHGVVTFGKIIVSW